MASMPRGEPRSVPDPEGEAVDRMLRQYRQQRRDDAFVPRSARQQETIDARQAAASRPPIDWSKHPGFAESLAPVWGSAREAIADAHEVNVVGAVANGALAASDLIPGAAALKGATKAGVKAALKAGASTTWRATRGRMARAGAFEAGQQGHHWLIPQSAKWVPEAIRNHPANIKALDAQVHKRIHTADRINDLPRFNVSERLYYGTPLWAKVDVTQGLASNVTKIVRGVTDVIGGPNSDPPKRR